MKKIRVGIVGFGIVGKRRMNCILEKGYAKVYPTSFHGRKTASKQTYDKNKYTAAHKTLPFGTSIAVVNLQNNKKVTVTVNDRGPYVKGSVIEISSKAAKMLQISKDQKVQVRSFPPCHGDPIAGR